MRCPGERGRCGLIVQIMAEEVEIDDVVAGMSGGKLSLGAMRRGPEAR
jgi:hypothetical protein